MGKEGQVSSSIAKLLDEESLTYEEMARKVKPFSRTDKKYLA
jgi:hypothetical protein